MDLVDFVFVSLDLTANNLESRASESLNATIIAHVA